jgi:hypothetical protein
VAPPSTWTRRASAARSAFALIGAINAVGLAVLARTDGRAALLAGLASVYAISAVAAARALGRGLLERARRAVVWWGASAVAAVSTVGLLYRPGPMF